MKTSKCIFSLFLFLLLATAGWGATYYVRNSTANPDTKVCIKNGSFPAADCSDGTDNSDIDAALAAAGWSGTVILSAGTYSGTQLDSADGIDEGEGAQTLRCASTTGQSCIIDGTGIADHTIYNGSFGGMTINNIKIISPAGYWGYYGYDLTMNDSEIVAAGMALSSGGTSTISRSKISSAAGEYSVSMTGGTRIWNYCIFDGLGTPIYITSSGNNTFNNCKFSGGRNGNNYTATAMLASNTYSGNTICNNCEFTANTVDGYPDQYVIDNASTSGGTITLNNPIFIQSPRGKSTNNVTINDPVYADPKHVSEKRPSYISIAVDDSANISVAQSLSSVAPVTLFLDTNITDISEANWTAIGAFIKAGNELGGHTFCGANLISGNAITIASSRTVPTVEITTTQTDANPANWTGTMVLKENGASINGAGYSLTGYNTLASLKTVIEANTGWTATVNASAGNGCAPVMLKTTTQEVSGAGYLFTFETNLVGSTPVNRFWYREIIYHKKSVEDKLATVLGNAYVLRSFAYPGGAMSAGLETFLSTQANYDPLSVTKYLGARSAGATAAASWTLASDYNSGTGPSAGIQVYELLGPQMAADIGTTNIDRVAIAWGQWATYAGGYFTFYTHGAGEYSDTNAKTFIAGLKQNPSLTLTTIGNMLDTIRTSGLWADADADGTRWTRTFTDLSDYRLRSNSPARNAGLNSVWAGTANVTDFAGRKITDASGNIIACGGTVDIGAYEYCGGGGGFNMLFGIGF